MIDSFLEEEINFATGVPDSILAPLSAALDSSDFIEHVTAANEGNALALAMGNFLGSKKIPLIYLQNSGIGNLINPFLSLAHKEVYNIPALFLIGWRGEEGKKDEPQHLPQGRVTIPMLELMGIKIIRITSEIEIREKVSKAARLAKGENTPVALLVSAGILSKGQEIQPQSNRISRLDALKVIIKNAHPNALFVSTTGKTSREADEITREMGLSNLFLTIGGMGHCSSIALGLQISQRDKTVICLDGDGSLQMHMGALATIGESGLKNFIHIVFNNGVHESVGGQKVANANLNYLSIAKASGYKYMKKINNEKGLIKFLKSRYIHKGPSFIEIETSVSSSGNLGRPIGGPNEWKLKFMQNINSKVK